jgi:hypothetical protein
MKNTIRFFGIIALIAVIGFSMAACDPEGNGNDTPSHTHDFSGEWQKDATGHWKVCAAGGEIGQKAAHSPSDGVCSVCSYLTSPTYNIGDTGPAGGIIFYVSAGGFTMREMTGTCHYLEASSANLTGGTGSQSTMRWSTATAEPYPPMFGTMNGIGSGKNNTAIIIAAESRTYGSSNTYIYAARACSEYRGGGKDDWFLPSRDELNELYRAKGKTGIPTTGDFWSSSKTLLDTFAWFQRFDNGDQDSYRLHDDGLVRAVRAF